MQRTTTIAHTPLSEAEAAKVDRALEELLAWARTLPTDYDSGDLLGLGSQFIERGIEFRKLVSDTYCEANRRAFRPQVGTKPFVRGVSPQSASTQPPTKGDELLKQLGLNSIGDLAKAIARLKGAQ